MKKNIMTKTIKTIFTAAFLGVFASCAIGLGPAVDIEAPAITIDSPVPLGSVQKTVTVRGSASDNIGVTELIISIAELKDSFKWTGSGGWQKQDSSTGEWKSYKDSTFDGSAKKFNWSVSFTVPEETKSGSSFTMTSTVSDEFGSKTKDERSFTVDVVDPVVSIIVPELLRIGTAYKNYSEIKAKSDGYEPNDSMVLSKLINKSFSIDGTQKEDTYLDKLFVMIDTGSADTLPSYKTKENLKDLAVNLIYFKEMEGNRSWSVNVGENDIPEAYRTGRHLFRLITESHDTAGNVERKVQGWFTYDNSADIPWVSITNGDTSYISDNDSEGKKQTVVYPNCALQGQCYDDDGLKEIEIRTFICTDDAGNQWEEIKDKYVKFDSELSEKGYPTYYAWSVNAIAQNKHFKIVINCTDKNGVKATETSRYFVIKDVNPAKLTITSPSEGTKTIGTKAGNITISGNVSDDSPLKKGGSSPTEKSALKMVRICNSQKTNIEKYYDGEYAGWDSEKDGNKVFEIPLSGTDTATGGYFNYSFSKQFNIFSDFGIDKNETLGSLSLVFRVLDESNSSTVEVLNLTGDIEAPKLEITTLKVKNADDTEKETKSLSNGNIPILSIFNKDSSGNVTDKIQYSGTWSDDSADFWEKTTDGKKRIGDFTLEIKGQTYSVTLNHEGDGTQQNPNTWTSAWITPENTSTGSVKASLKDFGGNIVTKTASYSVSSSNPELVRISSTNSDGSYKVGDVITITLEYNKRVTFTGSGAKITLNNGGTATYDDSSNTNGTAKHSYKYTVAVTDSETNNLSVTSISANGSVWEDPDKKTLTNTIPNGANLGDLRTIKIDKTAPKFSKVSAVSGSGDYKAGKELFFSVEFDKEVEISKLSDVKLTLKFGDSDKTPDTVTKTGPQSLLYKYTVSSGDNGAVSFGNFSKGSSTIKDKAGNELTNLTPTTTSISGINVDTTVPSKPTVSGVTDNELVYDTSGKTFTISYENDAEKYYSVDDGATWLNYSSGITLTSNGTYKIKAYQIDKAGNKSDESAMITVTLDTGNILTSITSSTPDGTYTTGKEITITLNFRKSVVIDAGSYLVLKNKNGSGTAKNINPSSGSTNAVSGTSINYKYTVEDGDAFNELNVSEIKFPNGITDNETPKHDISSYVPLPSGANLSDSRKIEIVTGAPSVSGIEFSNDGKTFTVKYSSGTAISKGTGNIELQVKSGEFVAPIVMTKSEYNECNSSIQAYYEVGTNGFDDTTLSPDLTEKYILKYGTAPTDEPLVELFTTAKKDTVTIPIDSTAVTISGKNLVIDISDAYKLPIKGALYTVTVPAGLVKNSLDTESKAIDESKKEIRASGVEAPVIRINKSKETISGATFKQPYTASVKIDCRTNGATIKYKDASETSAMKSYTTNGTKILPDTSSNITTVPALDAITTSYSAAFTVGSGEDKNKGYKVLVAAKAELTADGTTRTSEAAYEAAYRTVVVFTDTVEPPNQDNQNFILDCTSTSDYKYRWVRGGDWTSGGVGTPGFPLSWNREEFDKIRAMTNETGNDWYWVTWDLSTTAYVGFIAGDMPADAATNGPAKWCWGSCAWVALKDEYPMYPGESINLKTSGPEAGRGGYAYQKKHMESR